VPTDILTPVTARRGTGGAKMLQSFRQKKAAPMSVIRRLPTPDAEQRNHSGVTVGVPVSSVPRSFSSYGLADSGESFNTCVVGGTISAIGLAVAAASVGAACRCPV